MRALLLSLIIVCGTVAAPGPKHDEIDGEISFVDDNSPIVRVPSRTPEGAWQPEIYWLVFTSRELEMQSLKIERGQQVRVIEKTGGGGRYRYMVVSKIENSK